MNPYSHLPYSHNSLKVFESVARQLSFTLAAKELHVTQSAVSRQVKQLEDELNASLIIRKHRAIELTLKGQALYDVLEKNYQTVETLIASWQESAQKKIVIRAALSYATRSLLAKIHKLNERYPDYEIVVIPAIEEGHSIDRRAADYDLYILNTQAHDECKDDPNITFLREEYMAPVCAGHLLKVSDGVEPILRMRRLHPTLDHIDWKSWLEETALEVQYPVRNTTFYTLDLALSACLSGQGATVTDLLLVLPELERAFLVCPEGSEVHHSNWGYYCHQKTQSPLVDEIVEWMKAESDKETEILQRLADKFNWNLPSGS